MGDGVRQRLPLLVLVTASVAAVVVAVSGAASPDGGLRIAQGGHWVASPALDMVFHINGGSGTVDARAQVPGMPPGSQVVQGETSGYVVGSSRIIEFGKSTLAVESSYTPPSAEIPVAVETAGGPYLVFRETGSVVRMGDSVAPIPTNGKVGDPVATPDGTLWLHRTESGALCRLTKGALALDCPTSVPAGHTGSLSTIADRPVFVDTSEDVIRTVSAEGLGDPKPVGDDMPPGALVAPADTGGRIAVLDKDNRRMMLVGDPPPEVVSLPDGDYAPPTSSGSSVVLLDRRGNRVLTYDSKGAQRKATDLPKENGQPRLSRGEDKRVYVDGAEGRHVVVVNHDGDVKQVPVVGQQQPTTQQTQAPPPQVQTSTQQPPAAPPATRERTPERPAPPRPTPPRQTTQRPPPAAVPASPPGVPPGVSATVQGANVLIRWGAAAANGAAVTAYHVSWSPATSAGSAATVAGGARSFQLTGMQAGTPYRVTVVAQNSAGRGAPATTQALVPVQQTMTVRVTRGETETYNENCQAPDCGKMRVELRGFKPRTNYEIIPYSTDEYSNPGSTQRTDRNGNVTFEAFHFGEVGAYVWVVVDGQYTSNRYKWVSG